jgi:hypothetical protein
MNAPIEYFPRTRVQLFRAIRRAWIRVGAIEQSDPTPGRAFADYLPWSFPKTKTLPVKLNLWLSIYDEFAAWICAFYICCEISLRAKAQEKKQNVPTKDVLQSLCLLSARVASDLCSIRISVCYGLEPAARTTLRSTLEHIDVLSLILIKPECAKEFMSTDSPEASNSFWHKNLSRDKLRAAIRSYLLEGASGATKGAIATQISFRERRSWIYGASTHPSKYICGLAAWTPETLRLNDPSLLGVGVPTDISCNTLYDAIFSIYEFSLVLRRHAFISDVKGENLFIREMPDELFRNITRERPHVFGSILMTINHSSLRGVYFDFMKPRRK